MLDLKSIRDAPEATLKALERRGDASADRLREALQLDQQRRELLPRSEQIKAEQNKASEQISAAKSAGEDATEAIAAMQKLAAEGKQLKDQLMTVEDQLATTMTGVANPPSAAAPDEDEVIRSWGECMSQGRDHVELAGDLLDLETAARVSGARFAYLKGDLVRLELAIVQYAIDKLSNSGFLPVIPPVLVREQALFGTGFLPDTEQQIYRLADDDLYLTGTSEVALASMHSDQILDAADLPIRYAGFSPCFRREAGTAGKDTQGIFRVHQFEKVEMFVFCHPEDAAAEHERILAIEESIMQDLGLPYRVVNIAVNDLGPSAVQKYDVEAWLPSQQRYRELTSCSNTTDFQSRRLNTRARGENKQIFNTSTLNGTATALGRTIIAILENHQTENGVVELPSCLQQYGSPSTIGEQ